MLGFGQHKNNQNFNLIRSSIVNTEEHKLSASGRTGEKTTSFKELSEEELKQLLLEQDIILKKSRRKRIIRNLAVLFLAMTIVQIIFSKYHF